MVTSASALNRIFTKTIKNNEPDRRFLEVVGEQLSPESPLPEIKVVQLLHNLINQIRVDLEHETFSEDEKGMARRQLAPFNSLANFAHIHLCMKDAKSNFLKPQNLVGLNDIDYLLEDRVEYVVVDKSRLQELTVQFDDIRKNVISIDLPVALKETLLSRLHQISVILENYSAFGPDVLERDLEALVGAIAINYGSVPEEEIDGLVTKITGAARDGVSFLRSTKEGFELGGDLALAGIDIAKSLL